MKCLKRKDGVVIRVKDDAAADFVRTGDFEYCPKHEYKSQQLKREETGDA